MDAHITYVEPRGVGKAVLGMKYGEPTPDDLAAARAVIRAAWLARRRARRAESRRLFGYPDRSVRPIALVCAYCQAPFAARPWGGPHARRFCSHSCRSLAYQQRQRVAARRVAAGNAK